jgi:hypothetical protein
MKDVSIPSVVESAQSFSIMSLDNKDEKSEFKSANSFL